MEQILARIIELRPADSEKHSAEDTRLHLNLLAQRTHLLANSVVRECMHMFWLTPISDIEYLQGKASVTPLEEKIERLHQSLRKADLPQQQKDSLQVELDETIRQKKYRLRHEVKHALAEQCRQWPMYNIMQAMFHDVDDNIIHRTIFEVVQQFLDDLELVRAYKRQMRLYDRSTPIYFSYDKNFQPMYRREGDGKKVHLRWLDGREFELFLGKDKSRNEELIEKVLADPIDGHKLLGDSHLVVDKRRNKIFLQQTFKLEYEPTPSVGFEPNLTLGVDLGYKTPLWIALSNKAFDAPIGDGDRIKADRAKFQARLRKAQVAATENQSGHGQQAKLKALRELRGKESDYFQQLNNTYAKRVVEIALQYRAGIIRVEDVNFTKTRDRLSIQRHALNTRLTNANMDKEFPSVYDRLLNMFQKWSYAHFLRSLTDKANREGITVVKVDPVNTSKVCCQCHVHGHRASQEFLEVELQKICEYGGCPMDHHKKKVINDKYKKGKSKEVFIHYIPADRNAAVNIALSPNEITADYIANRDRIIEQRREEKAQREAERTAKWEKQKNDPNRPPRPQKQQGDRARQQRGYSQNQFGKQHGRGTRDKDK
ncbi:MAG: zinc ribbon domain-containing protein [Flavobacteriales bacterium]